MTRLAGPDAADCTKERNMRAAIACANASFRNRQPFLLCEGRPGFDSNLETGVAGLPNGDVAIIYSDRLGPQHRGLCPRQNVSVGPGDMPQCKHALVDEIDLRSGHAYLERQPLAWEESWPASCAQTALKARVISRPPRPIYNPDPISGLQRWNVLCSKVHPLFEVLIGKTGDVACARVIDVMGTSPPPGLNDAIRTNLLKWRFEPPIVNGEAVEARWRMQFTPPCR